ncbi:MAG TPA: HAMP domain-containing sensor histidine kinase, partial [Coleofasciculaceae cyanobacterium]
ELNAIDQERAHLSLAEADRLERLLEEILLYAKPQILQLLELEVNQLIQGMVGFLGQMPEALERKIQLIPMASAVKILGDEDKLKQIFINLIRNACEAIAPGETVTCRVAIGQDPAYVCIQVQNGGDPIPADLLPHLGEPFYSTKLDGTGLGLAIVKRIVEAHGGLFSIQSDAASGTTMSVLLPIATCAVTPCPMAAC